MWMLDPEIVYLNHGSFGACPGPVHEVAQRYRDELERQPMAFFRALTERLDHTRQCVADFVGCQADQLALVPNATTGVNSVLRSLRFEPGDQLLVTNLAYNACANALHFVAERAGAEVIVAEVPFPIDDPQQATDAIVGAAGPRTRLALIDHITSITGLVLPLEDIARGLAAKGVTVLVDGAHAPGCIELDIDALDRAGVSYYAGNLHKWVCAPKSAAFLWVRPGLETAIRPTVISHGANTVLPDRSRFLLEFDWTGTLDPSATLAVPEALRVVGQIHGSWTAHMARNRALALRGRDIVIEAVGGAAPAPDSMIASMAAIVLPEAKPGDPEPPPWPAPQDPLAMRVLQEHGIQTTIPVWPQWPRRILRLSAQAYNTEDHYHRTAAAMRDCLGLE